MTVHRTVFRVEVLTEGPYPLTDHTDWLPQIHHDITDGADQLRAHLLRIGNDGTFFDPIGEDSR